MSTSLKALLSLGEHGAVAVVGCLGKTTLIELLAHELCDLKVLITPTTKIFLPTASAPVCTSGPQCEAHPPSAGIQYAGLLDPATNKLTALPPEQLERLARRYDWVLLEADGSLHLPCKGWRDNEPVIPSFATHTLGVLPATAVGLPASAENVLRLPEFLDLTKLEEGGSITAAVMASMACAVGGMLTRAKGMRILLINHVETSFCQKTALEIAACCRQNYPGTVDLFIMGSAITKDWQII